ncbi:MAG: proline dehydrogenase family protein [Bacteroidales bacterium]|nr:proline dehydrogenase family protein [Bacteroidales bacterium]
MLSFENTEIAFESKTNKDLNRAYFLFRMIANNTLVQIGKRMSNFAMSARLPVDWAVKPTIYKHFVGGETIEECKKAVRLLEKFNAKAILDYSVEGTESVEGINNALEETLRTVENAGADPNVPFAVFKPTGFTRDSVLEKVSAGETLTEEEKIEADNFRARVRRLCQAAFDHNIPILIDAEDYCYQNFIDEVVDENMEHFNKEKAVVYNTYQMYRWDRLEVLKKACERAKERDYFLGAKFVRGAYMERERRRATEMGYKDPIHPNKESTDRDYNLALKFCVEHIDRIYIFNGTHNEYSSLYLTELMGKHNIPKDDPRCYFSQLYGMSDHISFNLAHAGYNVAKYLPYGPVKSVLPYLIRRTEENTSIAGQTSRELSLIIRERNRRKAAK